MADSTTPNLGLIQPQVGASSDTWGEKHNDNMATLDTQVHKRVDKTGDTLTGPLQGIGGEASVPMIAVIGSPGSGLYADPEVPNTFGISIDGVPILEYSEAGSVGTRLGVTTSLDLYVGAVLHAQLKGVQTDASNGGFDIYSRAGGSLVQRHRVNKDGWLGLGRNDPAAMLDVNGTQAANLVDMASGTAINLALGNFFKKTVGANTTFTFSNVPGARVCAIALELTNGGAYTLTWPASVRWPAGVVPLFTAAGIDLLVFVTYDGGTTWYGVLTAAGLA